MASEPMVIDQQYSNDIVPYRESAPENPLLIVHRSLRGRYGLAIACALVVGLLGSIGGWFVTKPLYESKGWLQASASRPKVLYDTPDNQMIPMFDAFVRSQADIIRSRRVIELALQKKELKESAWPAYPKGVKELTDALEVTAGRGAELIEVNVSYKSPELAQFACNAVLDAFNDYQEEMDGASMDAREQVLRDTQTKLTGELKSVRDSILRATDDFGGGDLEIQYKSKCESLAVLDERLADPALAEFAVRQEPDSAPAPNVLPSPSAEPKEITAEELARVDKFMELLLSERLNQKLEIDRKAKSLAPQHRDMRQLQDRLDALDVEIQSRLEEARQARKDQGPLATGGLPQTSHDMYKNLKTRREQIADQVQKLSKVRVQVESMREAESGIRSRLAETTKALESRQVEKELNREKHRVRIMQRAATPIEPTKDRRIPLAAAGFFGGAGLVIGIFVLMSLVQGQLRYADELEATDRMLPLLGVIPEARAGDPESVESVTFALHNIRNSLLLYRKPTRPGGTVYLVTSAVKGEGKTTFGIALGASFAQAGYRTTLVDFDLIGRGMTRELALDGRPGLAEALSGTLTAERLHPSYVDGLTVLPAGLQDDDLDHRLTAEAIRTLIDELRQRADIVVIDTGPLLGSLEVGLLAPMCDAVVLVASRGTSSRLVNAAVARARQLCSNGVALIFNRARRLDLTTSASYSSFRSQAQDIDPSKRTPGTDRGRLLRILSPQPGSKQEQDAPRS